MISGYCQTSFQPKLKWSGTCWFIDRGWTAFLSLNLRNQSSEGATKVNSRNAKKALPHKKMHVRNIFSSKALLQCSNLQRWKAHAELKCTTTHDNYATGKSRPFRLGRICTSIVYTPDVQSSIVYQKPPTPYRWENITSGRRDNV